MSKKNKDKKSTWALYISIVALLLCLLVLALWVFEVMPHSVITPDSFIGACVSLLAVIVTLAVGSQIINVMEIIDDSLYHCGHSLKDMGQKLSAISLMGTPAQDIINQVR